MKVDRKQEIVLVAEDDEDHFLLAAEAFEAAGFEKQIHRVRDGEELLNYLLRRGEFAELQKTPLPKLILLDLNMPRKDGREALKEIQSFSELKRIPTLVLTTSHSQEDVKQGYELGINSFFEKPSRFEQWVEMMSLIKKYWFETIDIP